MTLVKCLVVDDDPSFLSAVVRLIRTGGYEVQGFETIDALLSELPLPLNCCILADVVLRGESGLDIPGKLCRRGDQTPIVFMSATDDQSEIDIASSDGAAPCLRKPFEADVLFTSLDVALRRAAKTEINSHQGKWSRHR